MKTIEIDNELYEIVSPNYSDNVYDLVVNLLPMQAIVYGKMYFYRTKDGKAKMCYIDDTRNNTEI